MRRRGVRVFIFVALIVALSIAALSFKEIHIGNLDRDGGGPLGLTLGLDLQGGSHLVYQANLPDQVKVTFEEDVENAELRALLDELGHSKAIIRKTKYVLEDLSLIEAARQELRRRLESEVGAIEALGTGDEVVEVTFVRTADESDLRFALDQLEYADATVESLDQRVYTIHNLTLAERGLGELGRALDEDIAPVTFLTEVEVPDTGDAALAVTFQDPVDESDLTSLLVLGGHTGVTISSPAQREFRVQNLILDNANSVELEAAFTTSLAAIEPGRFEVTINEPGPNDMDQVVETINRRINAIGTTEPIIQKFGDDRVIVQLPGVGGSTIDIGFRPIPTAVDLALVLRTVGRTDDELAQTSLESFVLRTEEPLSQEERDELRERMDLLLGPLTFFEATGDKEIALSFPLPPDEPTLNLVLQNLGHTEYTLQLSPSLLDYTIRTEEVLGTEDQERLKEALESQVASRVVSFEVSGGIEEAKNLIGSTAQLVFKERTCDDPNCLTFTDTEIGLTGKELTRAEPGRDPVLQVPQVTVRFNSTGRDIFRALTTRLAGDQLKRIAIFLDDEEISAPTVQSPILNGVGQITGGFTRESARRLAIQLESGRLPVPLELIGESSVEAFLGEDSLRKSLLAGAVGLGLVLLFMVAYYRMAGVVAGSALIVYAIIVLAIIKLIPITLILSGIAGLVLSIGLAVDANILIFERMKEEMRTGRTLTSAMEAGFRRAWPAIRDSNVSTMITCAILFFFGSRLGAGTPVVTGFSVTLLIGVAVSMFTALMVSRNMLQIVALTPAGKKMALFTPEPPRQLAAAGGGR